MRLLCIVKGYRYVDKHLVVIPCGLWALPTTYYRCPTILLSISNKMIVRFVIVLGINYFCINKATR